MGGSKKVTVGYWYKLLLHYGLTRGPVDAFLEFRGGDRTAWSGEMTESGTIQINAPNLWGGEKSEGGINGSADIMFGAQDQMPNAWLLANQGGRQPAYRGKLTFLFKGGRFGINPYPKSVAFKVRRILAGWSGFDEDKPWYPERAEIPMGAERTPVASEWPWKMRDADYFVVGGAQEVSGVWAALQGFWHGNVDSFRITKGVARYTTPEYAVPSVAFGDAGSDPHYASVTLLLRMLGADQSTTFTDDKGHAVQSFGGAKIVTNRSKFGGSSAYFDGVDDLLKVTMGGDVDMSGGPWTLDAWVWLDSFKTAGYGRALLGFGPVDTGENDTTWFATGNAWRFQQLDGGFKPGLLQNVEPYADLGRWAFVSLCWDGANYWMHQDGKLITASGARRGANPAHMVLEAQIAADMQAEPIENIDLESFAAAADRLYQEGFALCTTYDHARESPEQFQERICNVAGMNLSQSRIDGRYRLDLVRGDYVLDELPILADQDILEWSREPTDPNDSVNEVTVAWFDPITREQRVTQPLHSLGAIQSARAVISELGEYPEIPLESLALRVAARDLKAKSSPGNRFKLTTTRRPWGWRAGTFFRLQAPRRGIADMVCMVGEIGAGTLLDGAMSLVVIQDVTGMPETTYVDIEPGVDTTPNEAPEAPLAQTIIEAPYVELATTLPATELAALSEESGYILAMAVRPSNGLNFTLYTRAGIADYADQGVVDWCPSALVEQAATRDPTETTFDLTGGRDLDRVDVNTLALWGDELVRVDAIDADARTLQVARGSADTVPQEHPAGERIYFFDAWAGSDQIEYVDGEIVAAKMLTNTGSQELNLDLAPASTTEMASRAARPYPPAALKVDGVFVPDDIISGAFDVTWAHRDRVAQQDQLVGWTEGSIGPEVGTTYLAAFYDADSEPGDEPILELGPTNGTTFAAVELEFTGEVRLEMRSVRDDLESWQRATVHFLHEAAGTGSVIRIAQDGRYRVAEGQGRSRVRITED